jgi:sec-independent protein translocase protein TatB
MPSFSDSIFLFVLALLLFGPKRLPVLAREVGKWVGEFRRASNEFKMQMEEELRLSEQSDRQKQIAAIEAAAPIPPSLDQPEHPHLPPTTATDDSSSGLSADSNAANSIPESTTNWSEDASGLSHPDDSVGSSLDSSQPSAPAASETLPPRASETIDGVPVLPIATSGDLRMMPPSTGLPTSRQPTIRSAPQPSNNPLGGLLDAIPESRPEASAPAANLPTHTLPETHTVLETEAPETAAHGH